MGEGRPVQYRGGIRQCSTTNFETEAQTELTGWIDKYEVLLTAAVAHAPIVAMDTYDQILEYISPENFG